MRGKIIDINAVYLLIVQSFSRLKGLHSDVEWIANDWREIVIQGIVMANRIAVFV